MVLQAAIEGLNSTIGKAIGRIENAIAISDQAQKASLALGQSLEGANRTLDGSIQGLRGAFGTRLQAGLAALNAGFQGNIESVGKLINQQQLTNGNFKATAQSLSKLETVLGFSRDQTSNLAEAMLETNQTFGVSTDKLVASLDALKDSMPILTEAGLAGVPVAVQAIAGRVGPQMEQELKRVMGFLFDPSLETQGKLAALGLGNLRERMAAGQNPVEALMDAIGRANATIRTLGGNLSQLYAGQAAPLRIFGPVANDILALNKALQKRNPIEAQNRAKFFEQISVLLDEILAPLDAVFSESFYPVVVDFVKILKEVTGPIVQTGVDKLKNFLSNPEETLLDIANFIDPVVTSLVKALNFVTRAMMGFAKMSMKLLGPSVVTGILKASDVYGPLGEQLDATNRKAEGQRQILRALRGNASNPDEMRLQREFSQFSSDYKLKLIEDAKENLGIQEALIADLENQVKRYVDTFADDPAQIPVPERLFYNSAIRLLEANAENTATTADNTDPDKLKSDVPFIVDASITSLSEALLSITRRAVEEPNPIEEAKLSALREIADKTVTSSRIGNAKMR